MSDPYRGECGFPEVLFPSLEVKTNQTFKCPARGLWERRVDHKSLCRFNHNLTLYYVVPDFLFQ